MSCEADGNDVRLDLRDEFTATARLEKLKEKYQRQKQAVAAVLQGKPIPKQSVA